MITGVIRPGEPAAICAPVEGLRQKYLKDNRIILKTDFGSGGEGDALLKYEVKIKHLARKSSVPSYRAARLFNLVRFLGAKNILELGTSLGITTGYLAKADLLARVVSLEGCPEVAALARENLSAIRLDNLSIVEGNFDQKLPEVLRSFEHLDLVFFDGNHRREPTLDYFRQCLPLVHNDTVFVFDDIHYSPEMEQAWDQIIGNDRVRVSLDFFHMGWVLFRKELSKQHFILRYP
jgi:predicted O-methyltransferase YrrM